MCNKELVPCIGVSLCSTLVAWRTGNALSQINEVTLQRARLVLGWMTVHGTKPSQLGRLSLLPSVGW